MTAHQQFRIEPLSADDAESYQSLRLKALTANPECFCTTLNEAKQQNTQHYLRMVQPFQQSEHPLLYGAYCANDKLRGVIGLERMSGVMRAHRARIWGLVVDLHWRRQGIARQLCQHAISLAQQMAVEKLSLELTGEAVAALHLYRSLGFRIESVEPLALKLEGRYLDEIRMARCF